MLEGKARARPDLDFIAVGNRDLEARRDGMALAGHQVEILGRDHVHASCPLGGILWKGQSLAMGQAGQANLNGHPAFVPQD